MPDSSPSKPSHSVSTLRPISQSMKYKPGTTGLFLLLVFLMVATRSHHFASVTHLPDASWAIFFLAGFYLRPLWVFAALVGMATASDFLAIRYFSVSDFCVSAAYGFLVPAYGALWFAGRRFKAIYRFHPSALAWLAVYALGGAAICEFFSSGGFYFFSGRFADTTLAEFGARLVRYFPVSLEGMALYLAAAIIVHVALTVVTSGSASRAMGRAH